MVPSRLGCIIGFVWANGALRALCDKEGSLVKAEERHQDLDLMGYYKNPQYD